MSYVTDIPSLQSQSRRTSRLPSVYLDLFAVLQATHYTALQYACKICLHTFYKVDSELRVL